MIDEKELKAWIARLETEQSSWPNYEKLAALYIIQNQHEGQRNPAPMLMYGKEASNRKQEIDRQHYTIPNQRPKDKHCGKI